MIVDTTCSTKRRWPVYADLRLDHNPAVKPDIVADCRHLPLPDGSADEIYCDPPHFVRTHGNRELPATVDTVIGPSASAKVGKGYRHFSAWPSMDEYHAFLTGIDAEFFRVLKHGGRLHYKTTDGSRSRGTTIRWMDAVERLSNFVLVEIDKRVSTGYFARYHAAKHGTTTYTYYLTFERLAGGGDSE